MRCRLCRRRPTLCRSSSAGPEFCSQSLCKTELARTSLEAPDAEPSCENITMNDVVDVTTIRQLNDQLRHSLRGGVLVTTAGVRALGEGRQLEILKAVAEFDRFDADNDPYGEHYFGALEVGEERLFFKIDYYDQALSNHSPDPADPTVTKRVLTIMLAEEY